jgi:hypothetical protein
VNFLSGIEPKSPGPSFESPEQAEGGPTEVSRIDDPKAAYERRASKLPAFDERHRQDLRCRNEKVGIVQKHCAIIAPSSWGRMAT